MSEPIREIRGIANLLAGADRADLEARVHDMLDGRPAA